MNERIQKLESCLEKSLKLLERVNLNTVKMCPEDLGMPQFKDGACKPGFTCNDCFKATLQLLGEQDDNERLCLSCKEYVSKEDAQHVEEIKSGWVCNGCLAERENNED